MALKYFDLSDSTAHSAVSAPVGLTATITGATAADPVVITAANDFTDGDLVSIASVVGMVELNGNVYTVASRTATTFELSGIDGALYTAYTSGGVATKVMGVTGDIRVIYNDACAPDVLYNALRKAAEKVAEWSYAV